MTREMFLLRLSLEPIKNESEFDRYRESKKLF